MMKWCKTLLGAIRSFGKDPCPGSSLERWMSDAGFENVQHVKYRLPIGPWAKDKHLVCLRGIDLLSSQTSRNGLPMELTQD